jgi:dTDP-4-dehydrorhamnose 3,5-epimerase/reductase
MTKLIIGANGQLGQALQAQYPGARAVDVTELDITSKHALATYDWADIDTILNAAAYTNVDGAETEGRLAAWAINADAVANLVAVAAQHDMTLVHISTDYVFDGTQSPHLEDEAFSPLSVYGSTKAAGDLVVSLAPKYYILRTSWVIGDGNNFVRTMLDLGQKGVSPAVVADQVGRLTFTSELVRVIDHLLTNQNPYGTYNISNDGEPNSWADITRKIFKLAGFNLEVTDTTTAEYYAGKSGIAPRPLQSTLDLNKIHDSGFTSRKWEDDLADYIKKELA